MVADLLATPAPANVLAMKASDDVQERSAVAGSEL